MTHEELLAKIDAIKTTGQINIVGMKKALRAVVELHSPFDNLAGEFCTVCTAMAPTDEYALYPCPTIQAIEKELK